MKILTYIPIAPRRPKIYARTIQSIFNMDCPWPMNIVFGRDDEPTGTKYQNICQKHNEARELVLKGDYDALFLVENDMVVPKDILTRLTTACEDVAYGLYVNRHGWNRWLAFSNIGPTSGTSFSDEEELARSVWGKVAESKGVGMGCTLIRRHVLENIRFRTDSQEIVADDWLFSLDCIERGYQQVHDFGALCGHISVSQRGAFILWPNIDSYRHVEVEALDGSQFKILQPGESVDIDINSFGVQNIWRLKNESDRSGLLD